MAKNTKNKHDFKDFLLELIPECPAAPMRLMIKSDMGMSLELNKSSQIYFHALDEAAGLNVVMIKLDGTTVTPPEVTFALSDAELLMFQKASALPVTHL